VLDEIARNAPKRSHVYTLMDNCGTPKTKLVRD